MSDTERAAVVKARKEAGGKGKKKAKRERQASVSGVDSGDGNGDGNTPALTSTPRTPATSFGGEPIVARLETEVVETPTWTDDRSCLTWP